MCRHMSPAHGALIKISNCVHLCSLAGLLKRQGPPHPSGPLLPLRSIMFAILRNGLENSRSPLENLHPQTQSPPVTPRLGARLIHCVSKENEGRQETCLMPLTTIPAARNAIPVSPAPQVDDRVWSLCFLHWEKKSEYYYPLNTV